MTARPPDDLDMAEWLASAIYSQASQIVKLPNPLWRIARIYAVQAAKLILERDQEVKL